VSSRNWRFLSGADGVDLSDEHRAGADVDDFAAGFAVSAVKEERVDGGLDGFDWSGAVRADDRPDGSD
jgi:hypothetical protein